MTVISVKKGAESGVYTVGLDTGSFFICREDYLDKTVLELSLLEAHTELNFDAAEALAFSSRCLAAERQALRLISFQEHSSELLRKKLLKREHGEKEIQKALSFLEGQGLIDDNRFAKLYLDSLFRRRPRGRTFLYRKLRAKGISENICQHVLKDFWNEERKAEAFTRWFILRGKGIPQKIDAELKKELYRDGFNVSDLRHYLDFFPEDVPEKNNLEN